MSLREKIIPGVNQALDYLEKFVDVSLPRVRKLKVASEVQYNSRLNTLDYDPHEFLGLSFSEQIWYYGNLAGMVISEVIHETHTENSRELFRTTETLAREQHIIPSFNPAACDNDFYFAIARTVPIVCEVAYTRHKLGLEEAEKRISIIREGLSSDICPFSVLEAIAWCEHPKEFLGIRTRDDYLEACRKTGIKGVLLNPNCQAQWEQMYCNALVTTAFDDLSCKFGMLGCSPPKVDITSHPDYLQYNAQTHRIDISRSCLYPPSTELLQRFSIATLTASYLFGLRNPVVNERIMERSNLANKAHLPELTLSLPDEVGFLSQFSTVITLAGAIYHLTELDKPNIGRFIARIAPISNARSKAVEFVEAVSLSARQPPECLAQLAAVTSEEDYAKFCERRNQKSYLLNSDRPLPQLIVIPSGKLLVVEQAEEKENS